MSWLNFLDQASREASGFELQVFADWSFGHDEGEYHGVRQIRAVEEFYDIDMAGVDQ